MLRRSFLKCLGAALVGIALPLKGLTNELPRLREAPKLAEKAWGSFSFRNSGSQIEVVTLLDEEGFTLCKAVLHPNETFVMHNVPLQSSKIMARTDGDSTVVTAQSIWHDDECSDQCPFSVSIRMVTKE